LHRCTLAFLWMILEVQSRLKQVQIWQEGRRAVLSRYWCPRRTASPVVWENCTWRGGESPEFERIDVIYWAKSNNSELQQLPAVRPTSWKFTHFGRKQTI